MEQNESPIYQWLSTVDNQEPSHQQKGGEEQEQAIDTVIATGIQRIPRIALEVPDTMHGLGNPATRKRDADCLKQATALSTHETLLESESHKRSRYSYDPRPRYKTREDRYEYKGPSSAVGFQSQPRKGRAKKPRRRRHTLNDDFHAMNVTGNRLTLRNNTNQGIFSRGRTSSPSNHLGDIALTTLKKAAPSLKPLRGSAEADLAFSKMNFLSRRNNHSSEPISTARDAFDGHRVRGCDQEDLQFKSSSHDSPKLDLAHSSKGLLGGKRKMDASHTSLFTFDDTPVGDVCLNSRNSPGGSYESCNKRRRASPESSSIPYTWPESDADGTEQSSSIEQYLLKLMHVDMEPQNIFSEISKSALIKRYWSLSELWVLMWERKASWPNEAETEERASPETNMERHAAEATLQPPLEIIGVNHSDLAQVNGMHNETFQKSRSSDNSAGTARGVIKRSPKQDQILEGNKEAKQHIDELHRYSDKQGGIAPSAQSAETSNSQSRSIDLVNKDPCQPLPLNKADQDVPFPAIVPDSLQSHVSDIELQELTRVDDDDIFYQTLDAAYHAIVHPELAAEVASDLQELLAFPELEDYSSFLDHPESSRVPDSDGFTRKKEGVEPEQLKTSSQNITKETSDVRPPVHSPQHGLVMGHLKDITSEGGNDLPWLGAEYGQSQLPSLTEISARESQPSVSCTFWRRNRLY